MEKEMNQPAWTQVAEIEISYRSKIKASERPVISCSSDSYRLLLATWDTGTIELQEQFKVLLLNRSNKVIGLYNASKGGLTGTVADPRLILAAALKSGACAIILAHNHPSGNLKPSRADEELTQRIAYAVKFMDMCVMDHIIISAEGYYSFADQGIL